MKKHFNVNGLTIVEIIMTLAILGIVICPLISMFILSQKVNNESDMEYKSILLAQKYMEEIQVMKSLDTSKYSYNSENDTYERKIYEPGNNLCAEIKIKSDSMNMLFNIEISVKSNGLEVNSIAGNKILN